MTLETRRRPIDLGDLDDLGSLDAELATVRRGATRALLDWTPGDGAARRRFIRSMQLVTALEALRPLVADRAGRAGPPRPNPGRLEV